MTLNGKILHKLMFTSYFPHITPMLYREYISALVPIKEPLYSQYVTVCISTLH